MRILVAEDDVAAAQTLQRGLVHSGHEVDLAHDGQATLDASMDGNYDAIVLDIMMPGGLDGIQVCKALRQAGVTSRVIMVTARDGISDRVHGLDVGADDYLVKPFALVELLARLRAVMRRGPEEPDAEVLTVGDVTVEIPSRRVLVSGRSIAFTRKEFDILALLVSNHGRVVTRDRIHDEGWSYDNINESNLVEVYLSRLRHKLNEAGSQIAIATIRGIGYRLDTT